LRQQKEHETNLFSIPTSDNAVLLVQRFKDELQKRRQLLQQKRQKQSVLDVNMTRSRLRTVGGIMSASSRVSTGRAKNVDQSGSEFNAGRRGRANAGVNQHNESAAHSQEYVFGGDYRAFIDDYLDETKHSKNAIDLEEQNRIIRDLKVCPLYIYMSIVKFIDYADLYVEIFENQETGEHCVERGSGVAG